MIAFYYRIVELRCHAKYFPNGPRKPRYDENCIFPYMRLRLKSINAKGADQTPNQTTWLRTLICAFGVLVRIIYRNINFLLVLYSIIIISYHLTNMSM